MGSKTEQALASLLGCAIGAVIVTVGYWIAVLIRHIANHGVC